MKKIYQGHYRVSGDERDALLAAAKKLNVSSSALVRTFVTNGLAQFDAKAEANAARITELQSTIGSLEGAVSKLMATCEATQTLAASAVGLVASLDLPQLEEATPQETADKVIANMRLAMTMGKRLIKAQAGSEA